MLGRFGMASGKDKAVGAASQWWSNERMMVYFKLMMVICSLMMVKCSSRMVNWLYDHTHISPSLTCNSPSLTSVLPSLAWSKPSFAYLNIIEKLHRLQGGAGGERGADYQLLGGQVVADGILRRFKNNFNLNAKVSSAKTLRHNIFPKRCFMIFNKCLKRLKLSALIPLKYYYMYNIQRRLFIICDVFLHKRLFY